jgi:hypothetical protein
MSNAGWVDLWHMIVAILARQSPFVAVLMATGAVFVLVMAVEGVRTSLLSIWRGHRAVPISLEPPESEPLLLATPAPPLNPPARSFSVRSVPRAAATAARKRKPLTVATRSFRSPRPTIRRHPMLEFAVAEPMPEFSADTPDCHRESV